MAWAQVGRTNTILVTPANIGGLADEGVTDVAVAAPGPRIPDETSKNRRKLFPPLGHLVRSRQFRPALEEEEAPANWAAVIAFPGGAVGIIKRLSGRDTYSFRGGPGTPHLSMPGELAAFLSMTPYGRNGEPRLDVVTVADYDLLPGRTFSHRTIRSNTNFTHVGNGVQARSHADLRFNFLQPNSRGLSEVCTTAGIELPREGDAVAIDFVSVTDVRLRFVAGAPLKDQLLDLVRAANGTWAWLPPSVATRW